MHVGLQAFAQKHYQAVLESVEKRQKVDPNAPVRLFSRSDPLMLIIDNIKTYRNGNVD
jgi:hypothetical protein